jgi:hypothetical protein
MGIFATIGKFSAILTLIASIIIGLIFIIAGIFFMIKNRKLGIGFLLIAIGIICILIGFGYYYIVVTSKTAATVVGIATVANILLGGRLKHKI